MSAMSSLRRELTDYRERRRVWRSKMRKLRPERKARERELKKRLFDPSVPMVVKRELINQSS